MSANELGIIAVTGRAHCQRQVAFLLHVREKNENKSCWPADVGGKKNKKEKIDKFSLKMSICRGKNDRSGELSPACWRKKLKKKLR